jgi:ABC-2 type transport system permease protein
VAAFLAITLLKSHFPLLAVLANSNMQLKILSLFSSLMFPIFILIYSVELFTNEIETGSISIGYISTSSRSKLYFAKVLAIFFGVATLTGILYFSTLLISIIFYGISFSSFFITLATSIASLLPDAMIILICVFFALLFEHSGSALISAILVYAALTLTSLFIPKVSVLLPQNYFEWHFHFRYPLQLLKSTDAIKGFIILIAYIIIFLSAGKHRFENMDL